MAEADRRVDGALGIQTGGLIDLVDLTTVGQNAGDGHPYSGTLPDEFERLMGLHPIDETRFTFVDLGSGMGRAVLLAAQRPFARCVGVEFAKELHAQALRNLASVKRGALACPVVEFVLGDALEYDLPDGPVAIYLYNPFNDRMQRRLVDRLVRAAREGGREIVVYQCNACWPQVWDGAEGVERVAADGVRMVHRVRAGG
jgi:SAM-dependent methyltransferase